MDIGCRVSAPIFIKKEISINNDGKENTSLFSG